MSEEKRTPQKRDPIIKRFQAILDSIGISHTLYDTRRIFNSALRAVEDELIEKGSAPVYGWGKFWLSRQRDRKGRNLWTGAELDVPAHFRVVFSPSIGMRERAKAINLDSIEVDRGDDTTEEAG